MVGYLSVSLIPVLFTLLVGGVGLHYYATREQLAQEAAARSEAQRLAVESQLRLLRAQLEPHMLFNTLANLRSLVREDVDRAESMIDQLIVYLRSALAASQTESVALSREFAQLRAYLDIMALRMGPRLSFRLELPAELEATQVPPMLLQPLVENAIKHGLEPKVGPGSIEVVARATARGHRDPHQRQRPRAARGRGRRTGRPPRRHELWPAACARPAAGGLRPGRPAQPGAAPTHRCQRRGVHSHLTRRTPRSPITVVIDPSRETSMTLDHRTHRRHRRGRTRSRAHPDPPAGTGVARASHRRRRGRRPAGDGARAGACTRRDVPGHQDARPHRPGGRRGRGRRLARRPGRAAVRVHHGLRQLRGAGLRARCGRLPAQARHGRASAADRRAAEDAAGGDAPRPTRATGPR